MTSNDFLKFSETAQISGALFAIVVLLLIIAFRLSENKKHSSRSTKR